MVPEEVIKDYEEAWKDKASFPPVKAYAVDGELLVVDGFCRVLSAQNVGKSKIPCEVYAGTFEDALRAACGANSTHGLRRTNADKKKAANIAIQHFPDASNRTIAELCGVSHSYVAKLREADEQAQAFIEAVESGATIEVEAEPIKEPAKPRKQVQAQDDRFKVPGWACGDCGHDYQKLSDGGNVCAACICPVDYQPVQQPEQNPFDEEENEPVSETPKVETFPPDGDPDPAKLKEVHRAWGQFIRASEAANCAKLFKFEVESITKKLSGLR